MAMKTLKTAKRVWGTWKMNTYESIITRRSTRKYLKKPVSQELLEKVIEAGRYAPSGGNSQSNHFIVIRDSEIIKELIALVEKAFSEMTFDENTYGSIRNSIIRSQKGGYSFCYDAPVFIVVANQKEYGNHQADCAVAIENMMLEANELDLGSCYINQLKWLNENEQLLAYMQHLGMKDDERVYGALSLGYPDTEDGKPERKPLKRSGNIVTWH